jgi:hypothetical protein
VTRARATVHPFADARAAASIDRPRSTRRQYSEATIS